MERGRGGGAGVVEAEGESLEVGEAVEGGGEEGGGFEKDAAVVVGAGEVEVMQGWQASDCRGQGGQGSRVEEASGEVEGGDGGVCGESSRNEVGGGACEVRMAGVVEI